MTDTTIGDAVAYALDEGVASVGDGAENINSAGYIDALATHVQGAYVREGSLGFNDVDTNGNEVDVDPGRCFVAVADVDVQSDRSGAVGPSYDTTLGAGVVLAVDVPTEVTNLGLDSGTNDVWVAVDADGSTTGTAGDVFVRHGSGLSAPSDPSVKLGTVDADSGDTTRANDRPSPSLADALFPDLGGSPAFSSHDHSEGGLSAVPNGGLVNDTITRSAGNGLTYSSGAAGTALGGSATLAIATDGVQADELDQSVTYTFTSRQDFTDGLAATSTADLTSTAGTNAGELRRHDGTGLLPSGVACRWDGTNWRLLEAASFSYAGDGTTGRTLASDFLFEQVVVEEPSGNASDAYLGGLSDGALATFAFDGELTVESTGGITVGDNSGDADPNTNGETYEVYAQ
jgi:hypothetical protein